MDQIQACTSIFCPNPPTNATRPVHVSHHSLAVLPGNLPPVHPAQGKDNPLLTDPAAPHSFLTAAQVWVHLSTLCQMANLTHRGYTPHSFRRGGAAYLFNKGTPIQDIQHQGQLSCGALLEGKFPIHFPGSTVFPEQYHRATVTHCTGIGDVQGNILCHTVPRNICFSPPKQHRVPLPLAVTIIYTPEPMC